MDLNELDELLYRYANDQSLPGEKEKVEKWLAKGGYQKDNWPAMSEAHKEEWLHLLFNDIEKSAHQLEHTPVKHKHSFLGNKLKQISIAATILLFVASAILFLKTRKELTSNTLPKSASFIYNNDIAPGSNKAVLILADGTTINLNNSEKGELAKQGNTVIQNIGQGQLVYNISQNSNQEIEQINQVTTPRGGQYQLMLADGTRVWLNAASSLKFPTAFSKNERKVELTGEAYFEVAKNKSKPFKVLTNNQEVEVLGTHFNINSYTEEPGTKTTLIEGSVRIGFLAGKNLKSYTLKPGQQSTLKGNTINVNNVNTDEVMAWKNGIFMFDNVNVYTLMNQIARWYDVEVEYKGKLPEISFGGTVSRFKNVSELLKTIELTGVIRFRIEERRIIVMQ